MTTVLGADEHTQIKPFNKIDSHVDGTDHTQTSHMVVLSVEYNFVFE